jgi:UDP-N-acetylglucosamine--N-acetylmuramyl-(pentapeptide) pyrophosphoryl-undecaprenol N-acetylglucosamine transferase
MQKDKAILLSAGGTGGHLFPAIALAEELSSLGYKNIHLFTDLRCQKYLTDEMPVQVQIVDLYINQGGLVNTIKAIGRWFRSVFCAYRLVKKIQPAVVIGFGGYPTFPTLLASRIRGVPMIVHEQNSCFGRTNSFFSGYAKIVALSYKNTRRIAEEILEDKIVITGDLIRGSIKNMPEKQDFTSSPFVLLVFGGSQGAKMFSSLVPGAIKILKEQHPEVDIEVIQQVRTEDLAEVQKIYDDLGVKSRLAEFFHDMGDIYQKAHLAVTRAGAMTIAELTQVGLPALYIPLLSSADNHQYYNARAIEEAKASWFFFQQNITSRALSREIYDLMINRDKLAEASKKLLGRKMDGRKNLADTVVKIIE